MIHFLIADKNRTEEKDGYEIPSFALRKEKPETDDTQTRSLKSLSLDETLRRYHNNLFLKTLYRLLDERKLDEVRVYKSAMISRQYYSKIRNGNIPKKNSILAIGLTMKLNRDEMDELLGSAGYAFTDTRRTDVIVLWCMEHGIYDVIQVNEILFEHNANTLR